MDALFSLPRKKSAGVSYQDPLLGSLFFGDQSNVDQFVAESSKTKPVSSVSSWLFGVLLSYTSHCFSQACNDFLAGNMLRSANRYHAP